MSRLVEDLLALPRDDARHRSLAHKFVDLTARLGEVAERLRLSAHVKVLALHVILPEDTVEVDSVSSELDRLFLILIDNAIKYTDREA